VGLDDRQREGLAALGVDVRYDVSLAEHTWLRIGGPADAVLREPADEDGRRLLRRWCRRERLKVAAVPTGPGVLVREGGLPGVLLLGADPVEVDGLIAPTELPDPISSSPGPDLGVAPRSRGSDLAPSSLLDLGPRGLRIVGSSNSVGAMARGRDRLFTDPDLGSSAARLLADSGAGGIRLRGVLLDADDPNVVVNSGNATASDVLALADWLKREVRARTGVELELALEVIGRRAKSR